MKSRILRVNKLNTKSQKKKKRFAGTLNNSEQEVPEVPSLWISATFLTYNVLLWLGQGIIFSYQLQLMVGCIHFRDEI